VSDLLKRIRFAAAVLGLVIGTAARSQADVNLVVNGGFENGFPPWSETIGTDTISSLVPHSGHFDATLQSSPVYGDPSWSQAVTGLTVGDTYTLGFYYINSANDVGNELRVRFGGTPVYDVIDPHTGYLTTANYVEETATVTATSTTESLEFDAHMNLGYFRLDDVSLTPGAAAVPAPSTMLPAALEASWASATPGAVARRGEVGMLHSADGREAARRAPASRAAPSVKHSADEENWGRVAPGEQFPGAIRPFSSP
jgi:hypothetical protein